MDKLFITGKMGSGKDFAAQYFIDNHNAQSWSRTELMKLLAHAIIDHLGDPDQVLNLIFPEEEKRNEARDRLIEYAKKYVPEPGKPRRLYQDVTEICQQLDPLCFEKELAQRIERVESGTFSLIADVRSKAAFDFFSGLGYKSLRVNACKEKRRSRMLARDGYLPSRETFEHPSETELDNITHDFTVTNDGDDLDLFYQQLANIMHDNKT